MMKMTKMKDKIRFSDHVINEVMEKKNFYTASSYHWYADGHVYSENFSIYFGRKNFWSKKKVKLSRRIDKFSSMYINITQEEQEKLWPLQYYAEKIESQRQAERDANRKKELEALEWWP